MRRKLVLVSVLTCVCAFLLSACGGAAATSMRMRKAEGEVLVNDDKDKSLKVREDLALYSGYGVETKDASYSWVDLDSVKLLKMDESSRIGIEKDGGSLKVQLENGSIFFNVTEPLKDDESMEIRTSTLAIGIRGTCGWVEMPEDGAARVCILEGKVECTAGGRSAFVSAGETAYIDGNGEIAVEKLDASAIPAFVLDEAKENDALDGMIKGLPEQGGDDAAVNPAAGQEANAEAAQVNTPVRENPIIVPSENGWTRYYYCTVTQTVGDEATPIPPERNIGLMEWDLNQFWDPSYNVVILSGEGDYVAEAKDAYGITYREFEQGRNQEAMKWVASFIEKNPDSLLASLAGQCGDQLVIVSQGGEGGFLAIGAADGNNRENIIDTQQWAEYDGSGGNWFVVDSEPEDCLYFAISSWIFTDIEGGLEGSEQMCHLYLKKLDKAGLPPIDFSR